MLCSSLLYKYPSFPPSLFHFSFFIPCCCVYNSPGGLSCFAIFHSSLILMELLLTFFVALLFSFLFAKLVSFGSAGDDAVSRCEEGVNMSPLQFSGRLEVGISETENRVEFVEESMEQVDQIDEELISLEETSASVARDIDDCVVSEDGVEAVEPNVEGEGEIEKESIPVAELSCRNEKEIVEENVTEECKETEEEVGLEIEDWEGIERSEEEKIFDEAAKVVGSGDINNLLSDVLMNLYGLHKVATEGPCRQSQPMPLMLSARAKWNAWQKLGNMSPEEAMEQYVTLLSEKVPYWRQDTHSGDGKLEPQEVGTPNAVASNSNSICASHSNQIHEMRITEVKSSSEEVDATGSRSLDSQAKE